MIFNICYGIGVLALLALGFYIFCFIKKYAIPQKILSVVIFLAAGVISSLLLSQYLPDAKHVFYTTIITYFFAATGFTLSLFAENKICRYSSRILFLLAAILWTSIYYTTFYLFHIPIWVNIFSAVLYSGILIAVELILKIKSLKANLLIVISLLIVFFFNYCALITLCFSQKLYSWILFAGSTIFLLSLIYIVYKYKKTDLKYSEPTKLFLFTLSQGLIAAAGVLMFAL